jgi:hypothetical protein
MEQDIETAKKQTEEPCHTCEMNGALLTAYGAAVTACELMEDEKQKKDCRAWTELLDPEKIESEVELMKQTLKYPDGPSALKKHAINFNMITKRAAIELVQEMMEKNENVPDDLMRMFRQAVDERKV